MKVLYLLNHAGKAGTERYVETLVRYLSADGRVEPYFAYNEPGLLVERMQAMSVPCRQIEMRSPYDLPAAKVLANLCREWGIELIHTHYLRENYIAMLAKGRNAEYVQKQLFISPHTAKAHIYNIYRKTGAHSRQDLMDLVEKAVVDEDASAGLS